MAKKNVQADAASGQTDASRIVNLTFDTATDEEKNIINGLIAELLMQENGGFAVNQYNEYIFDENALAAFGREHFQGMQDIALKLMDQRDVFEKMRIHSEKMRSFTEQMKEADRKAQKGDLAGSFFTRAGAWIGKATGQVKDTNHDKVNKRIGTMDKEGRVEQIKNDILQIKQDLITDGEGVNHALESLEHHRVMLVDAQNMLRYYAVAVDMARDILDNGWYDTAENGEKICRFTGLNTLLELQAQVHASVGTGTTVIRNGVAIDPNAIDEEVRTVQRLSKLIHRRLSMVLGTYGDYKVDLIGLDETKSRVIDLIGSGEELLNFAVPAMIRKLSKYGLDQDVKNIADNQNKAIDTFQTFQKESAKRFKEMMIASAQATGRPVMDAETLEEAFGHIAEGIQAARQADIENLARLKELPARIGQAIEQFEQDIKTAPAQSRVKVGRLNQPAKAVNAPQVQVERPAEQTIAAGAGGSKTPPPALDMGKRS